MQKQAVAPESGPGGHAADVQVFLNQHRVTLTNVALLVKPWAEPEAPGAGADDASLQRNPVGAGQ